MTKRMITHPEFGNMMVTLYDATGPEFQNFTWETLPTFVQDKLTKFAPRCEKKHPSKGYRMTVVGKDLHNSIAIITDLEEGDFGFRKKCELASQALNNPATKMVSLLRGNKDLEVSLSLGKKRKRKQ